MNNVIYLFLRRLRAPLLTMIVVYSISILGFVLIPGMDDQGNRYDMSFFDAVYFVSFMGSTIGFGEIPYAFTPGQRMWTLLCIYATVIAWLYGIGTTLALIQEPLFGRMMRRRAFAAQVAQLNEPFYLVCGYGVAGSIIVKKLVHRGIYCVVLDHDEERIDALEMDDLLISIPGLCADASLPDVLSDGGLQHPHCIGILAMTNSDSANLSISIASKLLVPKRMVISRTESDVTTANLESFGTDLVVDPFRSYAEYLSLAAHAPYMHLVYDWLINPYHRPLSSVYQKTQGHWIICGYGRFGKALYERFNSSEVELTVIDPDVDSCEVRRIIRGVGTEAKTLLDANIATAVGIIAGTPNDADNLSIIMTARELNTHLVTVVRQNIHANHLVFSNSGADFIMEPGRIVANRILSQIKTPLLPVFIRYMQMQDDVWAHTLLNRMSNIANEEELDSWGYTICEAQTPAFITLLEEQYSLKLKLFLKCSNNYRNSLAAFPLMFRRGGDVRLLPGELIELQQGDEILFCGLSSARRDMEWIANNINVLLYLQTGKEHTGNLLSRILRDSVKKS